MQTQALKSIISPRLFGRAPQLERLDLLLERVLRQRQGQSVLVSGEAGIGKTRLVAEVKRKAGEAGAQTLSGHCFEPDGLLPYAPIQEMLRAWIVEQPEGGLSGLLGPLAPEFCKLLPELAYQLPEVQPSPSVDPEQEKRRTFETLAQFFGRMAEARPLLLVCEDLHWSDETSLEFLAHLARRVLTKPVLLVMTCRSDEIKPGLGRFLAGLERERLVEEIALERLNRSQAGDMVAGIFELSRPVRAEFLDPLLELTDGNPFFIEEILKSLVMSGDIAYGQGAWDRRPVRWLRVPRSIQVAVQERVNGLSDAGRELLRLAAVVGRRFDFRLLQTVMEVEEANLLPLLHELVAAQLVVEESDSDFAFRHALTRNAIYATMLALERKPYHHKVADALEHLYAGRLEMVVGELAEHTFQAGDWEKALKYAAQAAAAAQRLYSPQAVIIQATRAVEAAEFLSAAPPDWLYRARGLARESLGEFDGAQADYEMALKLGQTAGDPKLEWQALLDLGLLWASRDYERTGRYYQQALGLARRIEEPETLAHTLNRVGNWRLNVGQVGEAVRFYQDGLALFEKLDDRPGMAQTLELLGMATGQMGEPQAIEHYDRAIELFRQLGDRYSLGMCLGMRGFLKVVFSGRDPARLDKKQVAQDVEAAIQITRETGSRSGEAYILLQTCQVWDLLGDYGQALQGAQEGTRIANEIEHRQWMAAGQTLLGMIYLDLNALDEARQHLERGLALGQEIGSLIWTQMAAALLAAVLSFQGEVDRADAILNRADPSLESYYQGMCACARATTALARKQPGRALELLDQLASAAPNLLPQFRLFFFNPGLIRAEALSALGQDAAAETLLKVEQEFALALGNRPLAWRVSLTLVKIYSRNRRYAEAEAEFEAVRGHIEALAETIPDQELKEGFLEQAAGPAQPKRTARQTAKLEAGGLTGREREVAALVAAGKSNHEIALILSISDRTAASHVGNILNKLAFSSRAQIATWAVERGFYSPEK